MSLLYRCPVRKHSGEPQFLKRKKKNCEQSYKEDKANDEFLKAPSQATETYMVSFGGCDTAS